MRDKMEISLLVLTLNEEANMQLLLSSLSWCKDIVVLDSGSADRTIEIANSFGVRVFSRPFDDFAAQRNYALDNIGFKYPWLFHLDADERFTEELIEECGKVTAEDKFSGYYVPFKMMFMGKWLRHCGVYPGYQMRLMKIGEVRFAQKGHGQRETDAQRGIGYLENPLIHDNFSKGLEDWLDKHNQYSTMEAVEAVKQAENGKIDLSGLFAKNGLQRRRTLKNLSYRLPARPWLKFIYMYFLRLGFLDGRPGLTYCSLQALYEYFTVLKLKELRSRNK